MIPTGGGALPAAGAPMNPFDHERAMISLLSGKMPLPNGWGRIRPQAFLQLCRVHRVAGLVYEAAGKAEGFPAEILPPLREMTRKTLVDNLVLLRALRDVASALSEEGLGFVLLKGASLLGFLYPEIQLRPMTDVDLLIRGKDWPKVSETLRARGYRMPAPDSERYYAEHWYHQLVESSQVPPTYLEFHWNLESVERSRIDPEELIHEAVPCRIEGEPYLRLTDDHLVVHLCVHLAHHYESPALVWVIDLKRLIQAGSLDWERISCLAKAWAVRNCVAYSLAYVERVFPGTLPAAARRFRLSPIRRVLLRSFRTENPALPHRSLAGRPLRHAVSMILLDRWLDVARYISVHSVARAARAIPSTDPRAPAEKF